MKNKFFLLFIFYFHYFILFPNVFGQKNKIHNDSLIKKEYNSDSKKEADDAIENIVRYTGLYQNFQIVENTNIYTAIAYIKNNKRYIAYNPDFMLRVKDRTKTDWGALSVLAHETGHHLSGHTLIKHERDPKEELEADHFSGFILYKMGASLEEVQSVIILVNLNSSPITHPPKEERLTAITQGWLDANHLEEITFTRDTLLHPVMIKNFTMSDSISGKKKPFVFKCILFGDKNYYFVDDKNRIISINDFGEPFVIGYKVKSKDKNFDWEFSFRNTSYGVDYKGKIWNKTLTGDIFVVGQIYSIKK
ncbi:MAG: hypothetical protein V1781_05275 [Bacteroidota bacterium]